MLKQSSRALWHAYDVAILDLDGVVYIGPAAVPGAADGLKAAAGAGMRLAYVTNNASRPPSVVARHLRRLGISASDEDVVTSAQAAVRVLAEQLPAGSPVFVIGGTGLFEALVERGLVPVRSIDDQPVAVVSGYHPELAWKTVIDGAILVRRGLPWVASNTDLTVPTPHGPGPGNGVLVAAVAAYAGRQPVVAGKPQTPLFEETRRRAGGARPLVVGDRLDTDMEGAGNAGMDSLLVMTGVTGLAELVAARAPSRPTYLSADLSGLGSSHPVPVEGGPAPEIHPETAGRTTAEGAVALNGWSASCHGDRLAVTGCGSVDDWWRVAAVAGWRHLDRTGAPADVSGLAVPVA